MKRVSDLIKTTEKASGMANVCVVSCVRCVESIADVAISEIIYQVWSTINSRKEPKRLLLIKVLSIHLL